MGLRSRAEERIAEEVLLSERSALLQAESLHQDGDVKTRDQTTLHREHLAAHGSSGAAPDILVATEHLAADD